jgi:hypothetical protein
MTLKVTTGCSQTDFDKNTEGDCFGLTHIFCIQALDKGPDKALAHMLSDASRVYVEAVSIMKLQEAILQKAGTKYLADKTGTPISDMKTREGFQNQNLAIQMRHNAIGVQALKDKRRCIGTLSSFFEGGIEDLIKRIMTTLTKAGTATALLGLNLSGGGHAVALTRYDGKITFFDSNDGVMSPDDEANLPSDLTKRFAGDGEGFVYAHVMM